MQLPETALHIVYNGEVYNHPELTSWLESRGHRYRSRCDTETVLRCYAEEGKAGVKRLRGMFAFAVWDADAESLFLVRDRLGIKPLYYVLTGDGSLFFSSEKIQPSVLCGVSIFMTPAMISSEKRSRFPMMCWL